MKKIMTPYPKGNNFWVKSMILMYYLKNLLLFSQAKITRTDYISIIIKVGSSTIVN